jgi:cephalosporin hydroxylase
MIKIDLSAGTVIVEDQGPASTYHLDSPEAFSIISQAWLRCGWDNKYVYSFTWQGRPIIQLPEDMFRLQELIYAIKPDVIIETGVAHGGSLLFYASVCQSVGKGRIIGVDIEIRPHNRAAIESHRLFPFVTLIEGSSIDPAIVAQVKSQIAPDEKVLVLLDSCHTKAHVLAELNLYSPLVSTDSYIVAMDGIMEQVVGAPRTESDWKWNNPHQAAIEFVHTNRDFIIDEPAFAFNEGNVTQRISYWPGGLIKRIR